MLVTAMDTNAYADHNCVFCGAAITQLVHHGIIYVPLGYTAPNGVQFQVDTAQVCPPQCAPKTVDMMSDITPASALAARSSIRTCQ